MANYNPARISPITYPQAFAFSNLIDMQRYPTLTTSWAYTQRKLLELNAALNDKLPALGNAEAYTVAVAGSYGRMEAGGISDLDFMILSQQDLNPDLEQRVISIVHTCMEDLGIQRPNPEGVFAQVINYDHLATVVGSREDTLNLLAQRMLILMEARPVYNEPVFQNAANYILRNYLKYIRKDATKEASFLLNDTIRYFRSICVNLESSFWRQHEKWAMRSVKLRHSRVILYAGLLLPALNASIKENKQVYLTEMLQYTPLERIVNVFLDNRDGGYKRILSAYDLFLLQMQKPEFREALQLIDYDHRHASSEYREMSITATALSAELTRFILSQRGRWSEKIFELLIL